MAYELPAGIVIGAAVFGLVLDANDIYQKIWRQFFPPAVALAEAYPFLDIRNLPFGTPTELARGKFGELSEQLPTYKFALNDAATQGFDDTIRESAKSFFCKSYDSYEFTDKGFFTACIEGSYLYTQLASYSLTNINPFPVNDIAVTFQRYSFQDFGRLSLDVFIDSPEHTDRCLKAFPEIAEYTPELGCFANYDGEPFQVEYSQTLMPGETLLIPIYPAFLATFQSDAHGQLYDGLVKSGFILPRSVTVQGRTSIVSSRPMSPSPIITAGEFEIRG